ncbi:MAG: PrsW family glutamic-type intramembrane protease, partial [Bacteroidales bacterium]|nr:PrsW family glutamic-type intramembrane protease [Bacteroidales bacterium]
MNIAFISAVLPVAVLLWFIYRKDKLNPEPLGKLVWAFVVGCLSVVPAMVMEAVLGMMTPPTPILGGIYTGYVVAGLSEELCKLVLLMLVIWRSPHFDEYFDGIVYAVFVSMGFACVENVMYVMGSTEALSVALMRGLLAVPAHFLFAVTMGYHLSLAKFDPRNRRRHLMHALLYPVLLHGTYDALLMVSDGLGDSMLGMGLSGLLMVAFIVFDVMMWRWGIRRIKRMQERSHEQGF